MGRDRWCTLAVRAFTEGRLSFSEVERADDRWKLREELVFAQIERELLLRLYDTLHSRMAAELVVTQKKSDARTLLSDYYAKILQLLVPYKGLPEEVKKKLADLWIERFGDPADPKVAERIKKTIDHLESISDARSGKSTARRDE